MSKLARLKSLGGQRQQSRWPGYNCLADYHDGAYESDFVSPYTETAGNVDASLMVLLQDWSSDDRLRGKLDREAQELGYTPTLPTNRNLIALLKVHFAFDLADVFVTNVFPFIKIGSMSARIKRRDLVQAAEQFALPQIAIVDPAVAVCLGVPAFNALRQASGLKAVSNLEKGMAVPFRVGSTDVWCQAHTGSLGRNNRNRGRIDRVASDWARMKEAHGTALRPTARFARLDGVPDVGRTPLP